MEHAELSQVLPLDERRFLVLLYKTTPKNGAYRELAVYDPETGGLETMTVWDLAQNLGPRDLHRDETAASCFDGKRCVLAGAR